MQIKKMVVLSLALGLACMQKTKPNEISDNSKAIALGASLGASLGAGALAYVVWPPERQWARNMSDTWKQSFTQVVEKTPIHVHATILTLILSKIARQEIRNRKQVAITDAKIVSYLETKQRDLLVNGKTTAQKSERIYEVIKPIINQIGISQKELITWLDYKTFGYASWLLARY